MSNNRGLKAIQKNLPKELKLCSTEEEVKSRFAKAFDLKLDTHARMDLYTNNILFEFKYEKNMENLQQRSKVIAQMLYYIRELKYGNDLRAIPPYLCGIDKDEAFFVETKNYTKIISEKNMYDWDRAASMPCPVLVKNISNKKETKEAHIYKFENSEDYDNFCVDLYDKLNNVQITFSDILEEDKKVINEYNFVEAFRLWDSLFGDYVKNGIKSSKYFIADLQKDRSFVISDKNEVAFSLSSEQTVIKPIPMKDYKYFWNTYSRCDNPKTVQSIWQRIDRLSVEDFRRFTGEFYTPIPYASKAIDYLNKTVGDKWWERGYRLWDMAAGTGNLEYMLPEEALPSCYISTLLDDDANYCKKIFPTATCFKYDYLNDDIFLFSNQFSGIDIDLPTKMPENLKKDLKNPEIKWIIFINPPFVTANDNKKGRDNSKDSVSMTKIREIMTNDNLGEASRELFSQFIYRISKEFKNKIAYLGLFSKIKYINSNNDQKMRDGFFKYEFKSGFVFNSRNFSGNKGQYPIGFIIWDLQNNVSLENQDIVLDVFDDVIDNNIYKIGQYKIFSNNRTEFLSKWCPRYKNTKTLPPFSSAIKLGLNNKDIRDRVADDFLCSFMSLGNNFQNQSKTALLSGPTASAGGFSVTPQNFEKAMVTHTVRCLPKATWINDRDQWLQPDKELNEEFISDCVVWSLFNGTNQTSSINNISYKGKNYQIKNELYPYLLEEVKEWHCSLSLLSDSIQYANKDRFVAKWLSERKLSKEAEDLLKAGKKVYKFFYEHSSELPWVKYSISLWDVGWYQIRMSLKNEGLCLSELESVKERHKYLGEKILPEIENYGFLSGGKVEWFEET